MTEPGIPHIAQALVRYGELCGDDCGPRLVLVDELWGDQADSHYDPPQGILDGLTVALKQESTNTGQVWVTLHASPKAAAEYVHTDDWDEMNCVDIFDLANGHWYDYDAVPIVRPANGPLPPPQRRVTVSYSDNLDPADIVELIRERTPGVRIEYVSEGQPALAEGVLVGVAEDSNRHVLLDDVGDSRDDSIPWDHVRHIHIL